MPEIGRTSYPPTTSDVSYGSEDYSGAATAGDPRPASPNSEFSPFSRENDDLIIQIFEGHLGGAPETPMPDPAASSSASHAPHGSDSQPAPVGHEITGGGEPVPSDEDSTPSTAQPNAVPQPFNGRLGLPHNPRPGTERSLLSRGPAPAESSDSESSDDQGAERLRNQSDPPKYSKATTAGS